MGTELGLDADIQDKILHYPEDIEDKKINKHLANYNEEGYSIVDIETTEGYFVLHLQKQNIEAENLSEKAEDLIGDFIKNNSQQQTGGDDIVRD